MEQKPTPSIVNPVSVSEGDNAIEIAEKIDI
jgi:hypothetical protein